MPILPQSPRYLMEKPENNLRIIIPTPKKLSVFLGAGFLLLMLAFPIMYLYSGWVTIKNIVNAFSDRPNIGVDYFYIGACAILFIGLGLFVIAPAGWVIYRVLWYVTGKEVIEINQQTTTISYLMALRRKSKEYWSDKIIDLRLNEKAIFWGGGDMIKFDYGSQTFTFGKEITEAEARQIIFLMKKHLQQNTG